MILNERKTRNCPRERDPIEPKVGRGSCLTMPPAVFFSLMFVRMNDSGIEVRLVFFFGGLLAAYNIKLNFVAQIYRYKIILTYNISVIVWDKNVFKYLISMEE